MDDLLTTITAIDGTWFAAGVLFFAAFVIYVANQIAKLGQTQAVEPTRTRSTSSNRKAGRSR